jgi:hypothetical protein
MRDEGEKPVNKDLASAVSSLTAQAREIAAGIYKNADRLFHLTNRQENSPERS